MATTTIENYVKAIFFAEQEAPNRPVPMGIISKALGVVPVVSGDHGGKTYS